MTEIKTSPLLDVTKENIEKFLKVNKKVLTNPEFYFSIDDNKDKKEEYDTAILRVIICFLSTGQTRAVSNTFNALNWLCHEKVNSSNNGHKVFVDHCYLPDDTNIELLTNSGIPFIFGASTHRPVTDFDIMIVSAAILPECLNLPSILKNSGIPFTIEERRKDNRLPLIMFGGAAANEMSIVLGPIKDNDGNPIGKSLVDMAIYGYGEGIIPDLMDWYCVRKSQGLDLKNKELLQETMIEDGIWSDNIFWPDKYEWVYDEDKFTIKEIKCLDTRLPKEVKYNRVKDIAFRGFPLKTFNLNGVSSDSTDIQISTGCSGASSCCSFCMESTVAGCYTERPLPDIIEDYKYAIRHCAPNSISWYSFNLNYYNRFMDLLSSGADYFSSLSLLNERLDIIANAPEQLYLARKLGLRRISGAIEGAGVRIRNGILNKNLNRETLMKAARNIFSTKVMMFKFGMILTGQETQADIDDFKSEVEEMIKIRDELGASTALQINWTPLVIYSQIALRHLPRITAENSYNSARTMGDFIEFAQKHKIRNKFNGKGCGTWLEQLLLDFGPAGTDWLVDVTTNEGMSYYRHFSEKDKARATKCLDKRGYTNHLFFTKARPEDWIFPNDHIRYATPALKKMWWERYQKMNFDTPLCLRTLANMNAKCHRCGICETPQEIKSMVGRDFSDNMSLEEVERKLTEIRHMYSVRVVVKKKPEWDIISSETLSHYITSKFNQVSEEIANNFYSVGKTSTSWVSNNGQKDWFGGVFAFDLNLKSFIDKDEFEKNIEKVNAMLDSCQVVKVVHDTKEFPIRRTDMLSFLGSTTSTSANALMDRLSCFDWNIRVPEKSMGEQLDYVLKPMPELKEKTLIVQSGTQCLIYMNYPGYINPYLVMASILGKSYEFVLQNYRFNVQDHGKLVEAGCNCGRQLEYSYITESTSRVCSICRGKVILKKLMK